MVVLNEKEKNLNKEIDDAAQQLEEIKGKIIGVSDFEALEKDTEQKRKVLQIFLILWSQA